MQRRLTLTGSTLRPRSAAFKSLVADELRRIGLAVRRRGAAEAGHRRDFPLAEAAEAHRRMEAGDMSARSCS